MDEPKVTKRERKPREKMKAVGVSTPAGGVYVGSLPGYARYCVYSIKDGAFDVITTLSTLKDAEALGAAVAEVYAAGKSAAVRPDVAARIGMAKEVSDPA